MRVDQEGFYSVAEFFVLRKYRKSGLGNEAAWALFRLFPGKWRVAVLNCNSPALLFWEKVIATFSAGQFSQVDREG